ncbi:MAG: deoxyribodipyrimidine photolyase [Planctomycetota bacterium]|jgi:deoxyribodipyrimidine photo-lyase
MPLPRQRIRTLSDAPLRADGSYVLYWMTAARRTRLNFALERAVEWARELRRPLVVLEALRAGYPHASERIQRFVIDGMRDNARRLEKARVAYYPYLEPRPGDGRGLLVALARHACVVVTDDSPAFFLPRMLAAAAPRMPVRLEAVDGNGIVPLSATEQIFTTAHSFRRFLQKTIRPHLRELPRVDPLLRARLHGLDALPSEVTERWAPGLDVASALDRSVPPVPIAGGSAAAGRTLRRFVEVGLPRYAEDRNRPEEEVTSGLSPYLHFGHVSAHEVFARVMAAEGWSIEQLGGRTDGGRTGFWGVSESAEEFLDQLLTWRELGYHTAAKLEGYDEYDSLPGWAQATLEDHADDPREHVYSPEELEAARTHDPLWNAAQNQLRTEGRIHSYLRMLWGKKILEWSASPREALDTMLHLNDRWALDGRDPNSVSGVFWCLGRYDRAWGPERPIFGKVRYMSSANTARKVRVKAYVERYGGGRR